jgi:hypothetical protein
MQDRRPRARGESGLKQAESDHGNGTVNGKPTLFHVLIAHPPHEERPEGPRALEVVGDQAETPFGASRHENPVEHVVEHQEEALTTRL